MISNYIQDYGGNHVAWQKLWDSPWPVKTSFGIGKESSLPFPNEAIEDGVHYSIYLVTESHVLVLFRANKAPTLGQIMPRIKCKQQRSTTLVGIIFGAQYIFCLGWMFLNRWRSTARHENASVNAPTVVGSKHSNSTPSFMSPFNSEIWKRPAKTFSELCSPWDLCSKCKLRKGKFMLISQTKSILHGPSVWHLPKSILPYEFCLRLHDWPFCFLLIAAGPHAQRPAITLNITCRLVCRHLDSIITTAYANSSHDITSYAQV